MKLFLKFFLLGTLLLSSLSAKEYCILAFSTKSIHSMDKRLFLKRFPSGVIEKYKIYYEFKLESYSTYKSAKSELKRVKRYYKGAFIINCVAKKSVKKGVVDAKGTATDIKKVIFLDSIDKQKERPKPSVLLKEPSVIADAKSFHIPLTPTKVSKKETKPKIDEPKILEPYEVPEPSKVDESRIYDVLGFPKYIDALFDSNDKAQEIFYQKKIDYILSEIKKDRYNPDIYLDGYLRTGASISAQSGNAPNVNGDYSGAGIALHVDKILYDGGYRLINHTYDILNRRLADITELNAKDRLYLFGVSIYSNLYVSQETLRVTKEIMEKQKKITNFIKEGYRRGKNSPLNLIDSKNDLLNLKKTVINLEYQYLNNDYILRHSIKSRSKKPYKLYPQKVKLELDSLSLLQKEAISHSSDIARESNRLKLRETDLLFQKRRREPEVKFNSFLGYGLSTSRIFNFDNPGSGAYWEMGLNFKLPIYNRNDINLNEEKDRLSVLKQKSLLSSKQRDVLIQVEKSYNEVMRTKKQIDIINEQLSLMRHKLDISKKRYMAGISPYQSYSDAVKGFLNYETQLLTMRQKYKQEVSILSILVGKRDFYGKN